MKYLTEFIEAYVENEKSNSIDDGYKNSDDIENVDYKITGDMITTAMENTIKKTDCVLTALVGADWTDDEIMEMAKMETHTGLVMLEESDEMQIKKDMFCQVAVIKQAKLLKKAEDLCKKPTKTDA